VSGARWLIALALAVSVGACGNDTTQPGVGKAVVASLKGRLAGGEEAPRPTADQLRAAITPEFRAQSGNKPLLIVTSQRVPVSSILTMFAENGGVRTYLSPDQISFSLRNGVLVATRGLGDDMMSADVSDVLPRIRAGTGRAVRIHRYLDGENRIILASFVCDYDRGAEGVVEERCRGEDHNFVNRYSLGSGGRIVISDQWVGVGQGSYRIEDLN
jgi:hypothetical protein